MRFAERDEKGAFRLTADGLLFVFALFRPEICPYCKLLGDTSLREERDIERRLQDAVVEMSRTRERILREQCSMDELKQLVHEYLSISSAYSTYGQVFVRAMEQVIQAKEN